MARHAAVRYSPQEVGETIDFLEWLLQLNFVFLGYREYEADRHARRSCDPGRAGSSGLGILADVSDVDLRRRRRCSDSLDPDIRAGSRTATSSSSRRRSRTRPFTGARGWTTSACARVERRRRDRRRGPADRAVHSQGVHGAGGEDAVAAPQARADPHRRGPDPGFARLQGGHRALRVVPEGRAVPGPDRGAPRSSSSGSSQLEKHGGIRVLVRRDLYGRSVSIVVALPREKFSATLRQRLQEMFLERFDGLDDRLPPVARRDRARADLLHRPRRPRRADPRGPVRGARGSRSNGSPGRGRTTFATP